MRNAFTMRFRPEIAEFVQAQASAGNRSVTNFVETRLLREKTRFKQSQRQLTVQAAADLLRHDLHELVRDTDETDAGYAARAELFDALLDHARRPEASTGRFRLVLPEREATLRPSPLHVAYTLAVASVASRYGVMAALSTEKKKFFFKSITCLFKGPNRNAKEIPSFLKKRSKKLLSVSASASPDGLSQVSKSFLVLFFKKEPLPSPRLCPSGSSTNAP